MKVGAFIQARMGSQRFPGKVLKEINGKPLLLYLTERLEKNSAISVIVIATSDDKSDRPVVDFCITKGIPYFKGSLKNVAKRFHDLLAYFPVDAFVRVSGDSPLLDQGLVKRAVEVFRESSYDLVTNVQKRSFPKGQSVEVIGSDIYRSQYPLFEDAYDREHVTPYFYRNSDRFQICNIDSDNDWAEVQLSVDIMEDFRIVGKMIQLMDKPHWEYNLGELIALRRQVFEVKKGI